MRRRFFVEKFDGDAAILEGDSARHLGHVLRAQKGQLYELSDGSTAWLARVESIARDRVEFALVEPLPAPPVSADITLLLSIVKFDVFEWALEKATELGVSRIIPLTAARSERNLVSAAAKRSERWRKILLESSQQSRRLRVPALENPRMPDDAFCDEPLTMKLLLSERAGAPHLRSVLGSRAVKSVALAIGPEGGWTDSELEVARQAGFQEASLGPLILRTETAAVSVLAVVNFALFAEQPSPREK